MFGLRPVTRPQATCSRAVASVELHHLPCRLPAEDLRRESKPELTRASTERLLLKLVDLLRHDLDQLLQLLELRRDGLQDLLHLLKLLLLQVLEVLKLLQLLRHDLQDLENLLQRMRVRLLPAEGRGCEGIRL